MHANQKPTSDSFAMRALPFHQHCVGRSMLALAVLASLPHGALAQNTQPLYPLANAVGGAPGQRSAVFAGQTQGADYSVNAEAAHLVVEVASNGIPADGQTAVAVTVRVFGADGKPLANSVFATLETTGGRFLLPGAATDEAGPGARDADRTTAGVQLEVRQGVAHLRLLAPVNPQDVQLRVTVGAQEASGVVSFVPDMRSMVAAGLLEGVINISGSGSVLNPARNNDGFEREIAHFSQLSDDGKVGVGARSAFFLKGVVKGDYLLTAAYDSDKEVRSRLLSNIQPDAFYPVYGDASLHGDDAKSSTALYVRVDKEKSYLLYGDFATGDGFSQLSGAGAVASVRQRSLGAYNRSATGVRWHYENNSGSGNVFAINDTLRQVIEEFASQGSGPYGLRNGGAVVGSEKVEVVVRDRNAPARILSTRALAPLADYTFEPFSGRIVLNQFLPSLDPSLNPVSLRVTYEVDQGGDAFWVVGADGQLHINESLEIGGSAVDDQNPYAASRLASANLSWRIAPSTLMVVEVAQTEGQVNTNPINQSTLPGMSGKSGDVSGQAWRVELAHEDARTEGRVFVGQSDPTFNNLASPLTGGKSEALVRGALKLTDSVKLYAQAQSSDDRNPGMARRDAGDLGVLLKLSERVTLDVGLRAIRETEGTSVTSAASPFAATTGLTGSIATGSGGGAVGFGNQSIDPVTGLPQIQNGGLLATPTSASTLGLRSDTVRVGLGFKATDRLTLGGEIENDVAGQERRRYALGGDYLVAERTRLYARAEQQTGLSSPNAVSTDASTTNALVFGADTSYWRDTQLFSEYRLRDALSGQDVQLASGVRNGWDLEPGLRLNTAYEWTQVVSGAAPTTQAASVGLDYTAHPLWRGSTKLEHRISGDIDGTAANEAFNTTLWQVMGARKINRDWTFLARNYLLKTDYQVGGGVLQDRIQVGAAYRDTDTNRVNALAKYEYKTEQDDSNPAVGPLSSNAHIISLHSDYHPSRPWWINGRFAAKWQQDRFENGVSDSFSAQLYSGRVVYDITENWDLGLMAAMQVGQYGAQQHAMGVEAGYLVQQNLWLSVGYNHTGFAADRDLAGYEYTREGAFLRLRFKFDQNLFAGGNKNINRALDR